MNTDKFNNGIFFKKIAKVIKLYHLKNKKNHNNITKKNILFKNDSITLINFEFSNKLDVYYDIANFFLDYIFDHNEWFNFNLKKFPSKRHINIFCKEYFQTNNIIELKNHQKYIIKKINKVINFWINWSEKFDDDDYFIYRYNLKKLLKIDFNKLFEQKVIYCDGTFDLPHTGHLNFFNKILKLNCKKLIVGIISDKDVKSYKRTPILDSNIRSEIISSFKIVDDIIKNCPFNRIEKSFLDYYGIDLVVYGGDPKLENPLGSWTYHYSIPIQEKCLKLVTYSNGISTSQIINKIKNS